MALYRDIIGRYLLIARNNRKPKFFPQYFELKFSEVIMTENKVVPKIFGLKKFTSIKAACDQLHFSKTLGCDLSREAIIYKEANFSK